MVYPQLPDTDRPDLDEWLAIVAQEWELLPDGERIVVAHSLGASAAAHAASRGLPVQRLVLLAPRIAGRLPWAVASSSNACSSS